MRRLFTTFAAALSCISIVAQTRHIAGVVSDDADVLVGAVVSSGGLNCVTGLDGRYGMDVADTAQNIRVAYMGYKVQTVKLKPGVEEYDIRLKTDNKQLGEVVVTGYQKVDRRKLTAAVTTVEISEEKTGAVTNIDQALNGQVAGLSSVVSSGAPGAPVRIRIRGTSTINGVQDPLWVLDGLPLEGNDIPSIDDLKDIDDIYQTSIAGISPSDIESVTVLKDAAATAIYGARAANGVIVITTKRGKEGANRVNFSAKFTFDPKTDISRLNLLNSDEKVDLELDLLASNYTFRKSKGAVAQILAGYGETDAYIKGGWDALSLDSRNDIDALRSINTDWNDILFRSVFNQEYNLSLSGGSSVAHYYTSFGYTDEQGNVTGVGNRRFNMNIKGDYQFGEAFKVGASVFASNRRQDSYSTDYNGFTNPVYYSRLANPYFEPYDDEGNYNYDTNVQGKEDSELEFNIFEERANSRNRRDDWQLMAIADAELKLGRHVRVTSQFGFQHDSYNLSKYDGENTYAMRKEKLFATYYYADGQRTFLPDGGRNRTTSSQSNQWTWKTMAEYENTFGGIHQLELMLGNELRHTETSSVYSAAYGYDDRTLTSQPVIFPSETSASSYPLHRETNTENAYVSWFANGSYTLLYRYTFGASVRFDGSDMFGVAKEYRYLPLYSVSGLWRIDREPFMKNVSWLDEAALRASYGLQGNIDKNTSPYLIGTFDKVTILPGNVETVISTETAPNPSLRWEKTSNVNVGFNVSAFDRAVSLDVNWYFRRGTDLIGQQMLPLESGFSSSSINWAQMENDGWEIAIGTRNISRKNFTWTTNLNIGINHNKVISETVAENATYPSREGYPVGAIFAYRTAGLDDQGYPLFINADGEKVSATEFLKLSAYGASMLTAAEQRGLYSYMGSSDPVVSGGFINNFTFKNWQLGMIWTFNLGMKVRVQPSYSPTSYDRGMNTNRDILNRWTEDNTDTMFPTLMTSGNKDRSREYIQYSEYNLYQMLDIWVRDCSYARLTSLRLAYNLPDKLISRLHMKSASLSFEARNLCVISTDYSGFLDPETMGNPYAQPIPKSFIFGINVGF